MKVRLTDLGLKGDVKSIEKWYRRAQKKQEVLAHK